VEHRLNSELGASAETHANDRQATPHDVSAETSDVRSEGTMTSPGQRPAGHRPRPGRHPGV